MSRSNSSKPAANKGEVPPGDSNSVVQQPLARHELVAFVIMPSGLHDEYVGGADEAEFVYEHIIKRGVAIASERLGRAIRVQRELDNRAAGSITADSRRPG
jgi:hypothetical protein